MTDEITTAVRLLSVVEAEGAKVGVGCLYCHQADRGHAPDCELVLFTTSQKIKKKT